MANDLNLTDRAQVEKLIATSHWKRGESVRSIERRLGLGKTSLSGACRRFGIAVRDRRAAISLALPKIEWPRGSEHWRARNAKASAKLSEIHRRRMLSDRNPARSEVSLHKSRVKLAAVYRAKPKPDERAILRALERARAAFVFQYPIGRYIVDFAFEEAKVALEVDGPGHLSRLAGDGRKETFLLEHGWTILRCRNFAKTKPRLHRLFRVLEKLIPGADLVSTLPPAPDSQHGMLLRRPNDATRLCLYPDEGQWATRLRHRGVHPPVATTMGHYEIPDSYFLDR